LFENETEGSGRARTRQEVHRRGHCDIKYPTLPLKEDIACAAPKGGRLEKRTQQKSSNSKEFAFTGVGGRRPVCKGKTLEATKTTSKINGRTHATILKWLRGPVSKGKRGVVPRKTCDSAHFRGSIQLRKAMVGWNVRERGCRNLKEARVRGLRRLMNGSDDHTSKIHDKREGQLKNTKTTEQHLPSSTKESGRRKFFLEKGSCKRRDLVARGKVCSRTRAPEFRK